MDYLRSRATSAERIRDVATWLLSVAKACDTLAANPRINAVTRISQARLLAAAIHLRADITPKDRRRLLGMWERVTFRIYGMLSNDARTRVGDYVRLAWQTINDKLTVQEIERAIAEIGRDFPIQNAVDHLRNANCYEGWETELRYFMYRYEEHLAKRKSQKFSNEQWERIWLASPSESIEHILPQSKATEALKHRLGNLVLLSPGLNSSLKDSAPTLKSDPYRKTGLLIAGEVAYAIAGGRWDSKAIALRENELLLWAIEEWGDGASST